jgi:hypothetical protein
MGCKSIRPGNGGTFALGTCRQDDFGVPAAVGNSMTTLEGTA